MVLSNMDRLEAIVARLPEAERVDIAEWGDPEPPGRSGCSDGHM